MFPPSLRCGAARDVPAFASLRRGKGCFHPSRHSSPACGIGNPNSELPSFAQRLRRAGRTPNTQNGVALIITLILLSVVTFMAITFLALSKRERSAVTTVTDTAGARLAADAALANAEAQIIANALSTTNPYNFSLLVSTNYINPEGYIKALGANLTNVNYFYPDGTPVTGNDFLALLTNLWYSPRPPVFIPTNSAGSNDFRFYLDLNRNGRDDPNGWVTNLDNSGNGLGTTNIQVGDPEWIGVLERPDAPHGPNNKFIARYAFIAVPVGNTLDLNAIHNQALIPPLNYPMNPMNSADDSYFRNQGVGSWEINLAAFLADLNTNRWGQVIGNAVNGNANWYYYQRPPNGVNLGAAFNDAFSILGYRYNNYNTLASVDSLFGGPTGPGDIAFRNDNIDGYSDGPLQTGFQLFGDNDNPSWPWAGADNTNHFFSHQDLFDSTKILNPFAAPALGFTDRLLQAGTNVSTYDRYTFYRLLSQLGTDSTPDSGKMNLNYDNLDPYIIYSPRANVTNSPSATNFIGWTPLGFFTNAADRLLRAYTTQWRYSNPTNFATTFYTATNFNFSQTNWDNYPAFGIGHIPVLLSNQFVYSSAVNRLLQLAANMYDATTNNFGVNGNNYNYPSVFRPTFWVTNENGYIDVYINGYVDVSQYSSQFGLTIGSPPLDLPVNVTSPSLVPNAPVNAFNGNVYGVPWIIGAKKGLPNFNEFSMESVVQTTRRLQVTRDVTNQPPSATHYQTNQLYDFSITNSIGVECWNSYTNSYTNKMQIVVNDNLLMTLTNNGSLVISSNYFIQVVTNVYPWPGSTWAYNALDSTAPSPFIIPLQTNAAFMPDSFYSFLNQSFTPVNQNSSTPWETNNVNLTDLPHFGLVISNQFQLFMLDGNHVIDYVQLDGPNSLRDLNAELANPDQFDPNGMWQTNLLGVFNQLNLSKGSLVPNQVPPEDGDQWVKPQVTGIITIPQMQAYFDGLFQTNNTGTSYNWIDGTPGATEINATPGTQAPYTPTRTVVQYISWQANDPLVHYVASDLNYSGNEGGVLSTGITNKDRTAVPMLPDLGNVNDRYQPWGIISQMAELPNVSSSAFDLAFKDPLVRGSDYWDFPANKLPTVGWLGRVHRGTPWQSVYLKASDVLQRIPINGVTTNYIGINTWAQWTGDTQLTYGQYFDAVNSAPAQDRLLFDLFTTAFNDNATRGTLSVNQTNLAAWSALFSGVVAISNNAPDLRISSVFQYQNSAVSNTNMIFQPAGPYNPALPLALQPQLVQLVNSINQTRTNTSLFPLQSFAHVGDILAVPQFTEKSPFLNWNDAVQQQNGISDEMYEWLPQQTMLLLRCSGSPRYVIYCYGQTLKPAPESIYTGGGPFFGMVTNYQIVSEIATRAVVRFGSSLTNVITANTFLGTNGFYVINWVSVPVVTNNNAVIENFNILPPD